MPLADNKKAQTVRNLWCISVADPILAANAVVAAIRAAIVDAGLVSEFSEPDRNAMLAVETALGELAALPGVTAAAGKYVPTHRNQAVSITGVND